MANRLSVLPDQRQRVRDAVADGVSYRDLAHRFGCCKTTIGNIVHGRHSTGDRHVGAHEVFDILCAYGEDQDVVAERHGLSTYAIGRIWCLASATSKIVWRECRSEIRATWDRREEKL